MIIPPLEEKNIKIISPQCPTKLQRKFKFLHLINDIEKNHTDRNIRVNNLPGGTWSINSNTTDYPKSKYTFNG